ncbi:MAG: protein kinase [Planctomycetota bacterium]|nr:protein kinase [Planctomycetota bacterium]
MNEPRPQDETQFGQIVVARRLATAEDVQLCLETQASEAASGAASRTLGEIMVERGYITPVQATLVLEEQRRRQGPKKLGPYELLSKLGEGGMSAVYKARVQATGVEVALKVLPRRYSDDPMFLTRFEREARMGMELEHPNIVSTLDFGEVNGVHYIALEYVDGSSLDGLLKARNILTEREALVIVAKVAEALHHAAENGLVHRDVKPSNIMLSSQGEVKLSDFGLVKHTDPEVSKLTQSGLMVGTPHYISPEQARGDKDLDIRADIYSLGATLYHLVTGQTPFSGSSALVIITKHLKGELTPPDEINPALSEGCVAIIEKMMARERDDRYASPREMIDDIARVLNGEEPLNAGLEIGKSSVKVSAKRIEKAKERGTGQRAGRRTAAVPTTPTQAPVPGRHMVPAPESPGTRSRGRIGVVDAAVAPVPAPGRATPTGGEKLRSPRQTTGAQPLVRAPRRGGDSARLKPLERAPAKKKLPLVPVLALAGGAIVFAVGLVIGLWPKEEAPGAGTTEPAAAGATARYSRDFQEKTPAAGWRYMCNTRGPIGSAANYQDLVWNQTRRGYCAHTQTYPVGDQPGWVSLLADGGHPGRGADKGGGCDRYAIAAYTIGAGKDGKVTISGTISRPSADDGTVELRVYVNDRFRDTLKAAGGGKPREISVSLGALNVGDTIYIAVGPDRDDGSDAFHWDFALRLER